jgi:predicted DNA-binding transcriptional regulator
MDQDRKIITDKEKFIKKQLSKYSYNKNEIGFLYDEIFERAKMKIPEIYRNKIIEIECTTLYDNKLNVKGMLQKKEDWIFYIHRMIERFGSSKVHYCTMYMFFGEEDPIFILTFYFKPKKEVTRDEVSDYLKWLASGSDLCFEEEVNETMKFISQFI